MVSPTPTPTSTARTRCQPAQHRARIDRDRHGADRAGEEPEHRVHVALAEALDEHEPGDDQRGQHAELDPRARIGRGSAGFVRAWVHSTALRYWSAVCPAVYVGWRQAVQQPLGQGAPGAGLSLGEGARRAASSNARALVVGHELPALVGRDQIGAQPSTSWRAMLRLARVTSEIQ
jgi:hypothetical protein